MVDSIIIMFDTMNNTIDIFINFAKPASIKTSPKKVIVIGIPKFIIKDTVIREPRGAPLSTPDLISDRDRLFCRSDRYPAIAKRGIEIRVCLIEIMHIPPSTFSFDHTRAHRARGFICTTEDIATIRFRSF